MLLYTGVLSAMIEDGTEYVVDVICHPDIYYRSRDQNVTMRGLTF